MKATPGIPRWVEAAYAVLVLAATLTLAWLAFDAPVEQDNASMSARDEARAKVYEEFKRTFGNDEILLLAVTHPRLLESEGLTLLDEMTGAAARLDGVRRVESLTTARQLIHGEFGAQDAPLLVRPFDRPQTGEELALALDRNDWLTNLLVSSDRETAGIAIEVEDQPEDERSHGRIIEALRALMDARAGDGAEYHLSGITVQKHDVARYVDRDRRRILPLSVVVLGLALAAIFRRPSGVVLPLAVTLVTVVWTLGIYAALGLSINVITSLLPPVIMVLSITTSAHLYHRWIDLAPRYTDRRELAAEAMRSLFLPSFLSALTTALGLASLAVSEIPAVRQFGLFAALGVSISLVMNVTLMPIAFARLDPPRPRQGGHGGRRSRLLDRMSALAVRRPAAVLGTAVLLSLVSLAGIALIRNNTDLVRFLYRGAPLYRDTMFIDARLTGVNALDFVVRRRDGKALTALDDMRRLAAFQAAVRRFPDVVSVLGPSDLVAQLHRAEKDLPEARLPDTEDDLGLYFDLLEEAAGPEEVGRLITPDFSAAHVSARIHAIGTSRAQVLIERVLDLTASVLGSEYELRATGAFYNVTMDSNRLVVSQVKSLSLALVTVLLALAVMFRSPRLLLAASIPNIMPVLWTGGLMGALRIDLSSGTAMIGSVVLGIAVDGTIHYLARFKSEYRADLVAALRTTTLRTGMALVSASVVLALGFWVGAFGSFRPTMQFSLLTGLTIITALVCDLLVLPACLLLLRPRPAAEIMDR